MWSGARIYVALPSSDRGNESAVQRGGSVYQIVGDWLMFYSGIGLILVGVAVLIFAWHRQTDAFESQISGQDRLRFYGREWKDSQTGAINFSTVPVKTNPDDPGPPVDQMRKLRGLQ